MNFEIHKHAVPNDKSAIIVNPTTATPCWSITRRTGLWLD